MGGKPKREQSFQELIAEIRADADRYNERFGRPRLQLIKGGGGSDSQNVTQSDKKCPPIATAALSRASKARFKGGFVLLTFEGERDKRRNGLAVIQRNRLKLIKGGKLTQAEEWQIQLLVAEWLGLQELKRLRGEK